jgi:protein-S-isoprenylcysteine O-methyltransferase Ste14
MTILSIAFKIVWLIVIVYWFVAACFVKRAVRTQSALDRVGWAALPAGIAIVCSLALGELHPERVHLVRYSYGFAIVWFVVLFLGAVFAVWARTTLGRNWSGMVTIREGHTLVRSGPYRWLRHPIYTGLLAMVFATAIFYGTVLALSLAVYALLIVAMKIRLEEVWMIEEFGDEYREYQRKVKALIPKVI